MAVPLSPSLRPRFGFVFISSAKRHFHGGSFLGLPQCAAGSQTAVRACDGQELLAGHGGCDFRPSAPNGMASSLCGTLGRSEKYRSQCV